MNTIKLTKAPRYSAFFFNTSSSLTYFFPPFPCLPFISVISNVLPLHFNCTLFSGYAPPLSSSWRGYFSVFVTPEQSETVKGYSINLVDTFISPSLYAILVSILCPCQDVIAEDAREGLLSSPSEPTMVT